MRFDKNAWPDNIREWLSRVGITDSKWMRSSHDDSATGSETLESVIKGLVRERNFLAHGEAPVNLLSAETMRGWISVVRTFADKVHASLQVALALAFPGAVATSIGKVDPSVPHLGALTHAIPTVDHEVAVGQPLIARETSGVVHCVAVTSLQADGQPLERAEKGRTRVSMTLSREVEVPALYLAF